jgi:hypothetical protein
MWHVSGTVGEDKRGSGIERVRRMDREDFTQSESPSRVQHSRESLTSPGRVTSR